MGKDQVILSRTQILEIDDLPSEFVPVPEWGKGGVRMKALTRAQLMTARKESEDKAGVFDQAEYDIRLLIAAVVEPKFTLDDGLALLEKNAIVIERLLNKLWSLSGITQTGEVSAKAVDEAEKGFRKEDA